MDLNIQHYCQNTGGDPPNPGLNTVVELPAMRCVFSVESFWRGRLLAENGGSLIGCIRGGAREDGDGHSLWW